MGEVFLAEQLTVRTRVAVKTLHPHISDKRAMVERFFNEAVAVGRIKHSGVVRIPDVGFLESGQAYLVMEYLEGETLAARLARLGPLAPHVAAEFAAQIASILDATQSAGIVHRDLKPENIFLTSDAAVPGGERLKVLDFGIAKLSTADVTGTSVAMGTAAYMAPEQWESAKSVDWRSDAYSLGCVMYEMVTGNPPFQFESLPEACAKHITAPAPSLDGISGISEDFATLVRRLLEKRAADRPNSMAEVHAVLRSIVADGQRGTGPAEPKQVDKNEFFTYLAAVGELATRKRRLRSKVYVLTGLLVFPTVIAALAALVGSNEISFYGGLALGSTITFGIAESYSRKRIPRLAQTLAMEAKLDGNRLLKDAGHVDSALP